MKGRSFPKVLFFCIVGLAVFQLVMTAVQNPADLLKQLLIIVIVLGAIYLLYRLITSTGGANSRASYNRAVKQSKRKYTKRNVTPLTKNKRDSKTNKTSSSMFKKKRKSTHLTVIEGKKGKKKDRASF
ncbi:SA1362 family protein [Ectobacillus polymachus]|uniref:SA1362 family protein n=1 Tax=Ectobacillus polymachus TaxID=1508806 RepID=UPI003A85F776